MKERISLLTIFTLLFTYCSSIAQDISNYSATGRGGVATTFATDYQTVGINPANLGFRKSFRDPTYTLGFFEFNTTIVAEALQRTELLNAVFRSSNEEFNFQSFDEKVAAADKIAGSNISLNIDATIFGASARVKSHNFGFVVRDRIQFFGTINRNAAEIAFLGYNASYFPELITSDNFTPFPNPRNPNNNADPLSEEVRESVTRGGFLNFPDSASLYSEILEGTRVSSSWYREYNFSYGRKLYDSYNFSLFAGVGVKLIRGFLLIDLLAQDGELDRSIISVSPTFGLDFGEGDGDAVSPTFQPPQDVSNFRKAFFPNKVGGGYGFDFGLTAVIKQNLYLGAALTNVGRIVWDGNVYSVSDGRLEIYDGFGLENYNIFGASPGAFQFGGTDSPFNWEGSNEINEPLPSTFRLGASYEFFRTFHLGVDIVAPLNDVAGNLENPLVAIGGDFRPNKLFRVSTGVNAGGNNGGTINFPVGLTYLSRKGFYEAGIATRDITTFFANIGEGSTFSFALGFARVKF